MNQIVLLALVAAVVYLLMKPSVVTPHDHDHDEVVNAVRGVSPETSGQADVRARPVAPAS